MTHNREDTLLRRLNVANSVLPDAVAHNGPNEYNIGCFSHRCKLDDFPEHWTKKTADSNLLFAADYEVRCDTCELSSMSYATQRNYYYIRSAWS